MRSVHRRTATWTSFSKEEAQDLIAVKISRASTLSSFDDEFRECARVLASCMRHLYKSSGTGTDSSRECLNKEHRGVPVEFWNVVHCSKPRDSWCSRVAVKVAVIWNRKYLVCIVYLLSTA